ncbi:PAS domain-containing protein [Salinispira pacifica]
MTEKKTLLLVEDEAILALAESAMLRRRGYDVRVARNGEESVAKVQEDPEVELVLMDIDLGPGIDGTEAASRILAIRDLPVVFLSSHSEPEIVARTETITSYGYILKSAGDTVLDASIKMAFRLHDMQRRLREKEEALGHERQMLTLVLENIAGLVAYLGTDERYIYTNNRYATHFGRDIDRIRGEHSRSVLGQQLYDDVAPYVLEALSGKRVSFEQTRPDAEGTRRTILVTYVPDIAEEGVVKGFFSLGVDITDRKNAELEIIESREQLRAILNSIGDGVIVTDRGARITGMNPMAEKLTGWPIDNARGNEIEQVFPIVDVRTGVRCENPLLQAMSEDRILALSNHTVLLSRDGFRRHIADSGAPVHDADGHVEGGVMVFRDVTSDYKVQERLRTSEQRLRDVFDAMLEGVVLHEIVADDSGEPVDYRIIDCNPRFEAITGIPRQHAVGKLATALYGVPEAPYLSDYVRVVRTGEAFRFRTRFEPMDREFSISVIPWGRQGFATVFFDVSSYLRPGETDPR